MNLCVGASLRLLVLEVALCRADAQRETLSREVVAAFPSLMKPVTRFGLPVGLIMPALDVACRWAAGGIQIAQTIEGWNAAGTPEPMPSPAPSPLPSRVLRFLPWIRR